VPIVRDGRGVRVALIDSGVDANHAWLARASIVHQRIEQAGHGWKVVPDDGGDVSGHGTACAGIVHRMIPAAEIVSIRALGPDGRCSRAALLASLRHCVRERFAVVNLSLGIDVPRKSALKVSDQAPILGLYEIADAAYTVGVVLVASGPNVSTFRTYPGRAKALIGVGRGAFTEWEQLESERNQDHEIIAPGTDVLAPALGGGERRWTGTSFACPFVTAHVARIVAARPGLSIDEVKAALHLMAAGMTPNNPEPST
jgi:subtilisin family serine protease